MLVYAVSDCKFAGLRKMHVCHVAAGLNILTMVLRRDALSEVVKYDADPNWK